MSFGLRFGVCGGVEALSRPGSFRLSYWISIELFAWLSLYLRIAAPVNRTLTKAAVDHVTPGNARALQSRWDSIITARALLMAAAVAGLAVCAATG